MSSRKDLDIEEVARKLHRVHIKRHKLHEKEQKFLKKLIDIRKKKKSATRRYGSGTKDIICHPRTVAREVKTEPSEHKKVDRFGNEL